MIDHIGITVTNLAASKEFYSAALAPLEYTVIMEMASYYGAFVLDPDGHNIEAVCHDAP